MEGSDDAETVRRIKETVLDVLRELDGEGMVRAVVSERLGIDLSSRGRKELVRSVIDSFLASLDCDEEEEAAAVVGEEEETEPEERVLEKRECRHDGAETMKGIVETVRIVLDGADRSCVTEATVYAAVEERLGMDLSVHPYKKFVQCTVDSFLSSLDYDEEKTRVLGKREDGRDDAETMERIEGTVRDILKGADLNFMTVAMVPAVAAERLGMDLSLPHRKDFVQNVIVSFLKSLNHDEEKAAAAVAAAVVQEEARGVEQDKAEEGKKRKRGPRVRRRKSRMREQSENTMTKDSYITGRMWKRRRMQWREQNGSTVRPVNGQLHYGSSEGRHPFLWREEIKHAREEEREKEEEN